MAGGVRADLAVGALEPSHRSSPATLARRVVLGRRVGAREDAFDKGRFSRRHVEGERLERGARLVAGDALHALHAVEIARGRLIAFAAWR